MLRLLTITVFLLSFSTMKISFAQSDEAIESEMELMDEPLPDVNSAAVHNFDADVILGDKKTPDVFFQSGSETVGFDALLLDRRDFNDYLRLDKNRFPDRTE